MSVHPEQNELPYQCPHCKRVYREYHNGCPRSLTDGHPRVSLVELRRESEVYERLRAKGEVS